MNKVKNQPINNGNKLPAVGKGEPPVQAQFKPGHKGPGRPLGSRNKLGEQLIADLYSDWMSFGLKAIQSMREEKPAEYVKAAISLLPRQVEVQVNELERMTDEELQDALIEQAAKIGLKH